MHSAGQFRRYSPTEWAPTRIGLAVVEKVDDPAHHQDIVDPGIIPQDSFVAEIGAEYAWLTPQIEV
ncbi:hypothetical protein [Marinobacterium rhizophilum]|uniref:hypothetical protein n=1 Tax=Marinobacterium rhizophilum TaxID=420402 RepID=UPI0012EBDDA9|nr:hypothetical protein [Marinobacterium rhizophilum]